MKIEVNLFEGIESVKKPSEPETDASLKFEFGSEPVHDEPSPKTPEFSEIVENKLEQTVM